MTRGAARSGRQSARDGLRILVLALVAAGLAGCTGPDPALAGVTAEIRQSRSAWAQRTVDVRVVNAGQRAVEVLTVELTSSTVQGTARSDPARGRAVPAGRTRDFPVPLGDAVCRPGDEAAGASPAPVEVEVRVTAQAAPGRVADVRVTPTDPQGHLTRILGEDCAERAARAAADLGLGPQVTVSLDADAVVGHLTLEVVPHGAPRLSVDRIDGSTLLRPADGVSWVPTELATAPSEPVSVDLPFTAARCDPHAVAEDKRGTQLAVHARLDGEPLHVFFVGADEELTGQVHDTVALACGWDRSGSG